MNDFKEKYFNLAQSQGVGSALTDLYQVIRQLEYEAFEESWARRSGDLEKMSQEKWDQAQQLRLLSRELWEFALTLQEKKFRGVAQSG